MSHNTDGMATENELVNDGGEPTVHARAMYMTILIIVCQMIGGVIIVFLMSGGTMIGLFGSIIVEAIVLYFIVSTLLSAVEEMIEVQIDV